MVIIAHLKAFAVLLLGAITAWWRGPWVTMCSGTIWYPFAPRPEDVRFADFGALAWINRWGGHAGLCTVAEHCVRVSALLYRGGHSPWVQLQGALHDAAEVYPPGDPAGPILHFGSRWWTWGIMRMKDMAEEAVRERLHLPSRLPQAVRVADLMALREERRWRMPGEDTANLPPSSRLERWEPKYAMWRWWSLVGELASQCAAQFREERCKEAERGGRAMSDGWDRILVLEELAVVARREADALAPAYAKRAA